MNRMIGFGVAVLIGGTVGACGLIGEAEVGIQTSGKFAFDDEAACTIEVARGNTQTTTACSGAFPITFTAEENGGDCNAKSTKVNYEILLNDGTKSKKTVSFGTVSAGATKTVTENFVIANFFLYSDANLSNLSFEPDCGGLLTGIQGSPLEIRDPLPHPNP